MNKSNYIAPDMNKSHYTCPYVNCNTLTSQTNRSLMGGNPVPSFIYKICGSCSGLQMFDVLSGLLLYPLARRAPAPNVDMPDNIKKIYEEAADVQARSPRSAAAMLRLCVQMLCAHFALPGKNINDDIGELVARGLPARVQQALDGLRVIGNNAVHPGQIDLEDDPTIVDALFRLTNQIVQSMITDPREAEEI